MASISEYIKKIKNVHESLLAYLDEEENENDNFIKLIKILNDENIINDKNDFRLFLHLLTSISCNHYRGLNLLRRIKQILNQLQSNIKNNFSNSEIVKIFKTNKCLISFFIDEQIINKDETFMKLVLQYNQHYDNKYFPYFYQENISNSLENYKEKRESGENESYICELIRQDSIEEFVAYVTKMNISLTQEIQLSFFETNPSLISPTMIEYAAFFGSIQIFQYLRLNNVDLTKSLWIYAIHGKNAEIIHLLEENHIKPLYDDFDRCFIESIECHHNNIANYIKNTYLVDTEYKMHEIIMNYNFSLIQNDKIDHYLFCYLCEYDYFTLAKLLLEEGKIDINEKIICKIIILIQFNEFFFLMKF